MKKYILYFCSLFLLAGCNLISSDDQTKNNFEIFGEEKEDILEEVNESIMDSIDRDQYKEHIEIIDSMADRAHHFPTNRYFISPRGTGIINLYDENEELIYKEIIGYMTGTVMMDIKEEYSVRLSGFESIAFEALETEMTNDLGVGIWEVGTDIEAGEYIMSGEGYGYVKIFDPTEEPRVFEVIGNPNAHSTSDVQLVNGQKIKIDDLYEVHFEPKN